VHASHLSKSSLGVFVLGVGVCLLGATTATARGSHGGSKRSGVARQGEQRIPRQSKRKTAVVEAWVRDPAGRGVPTATVTLRDMVSGTTRHTTTTVDGIFRLMDLPHGHYELKIEKEDFQTYTRPDMELTPPEILEMDVTLQPSGGPTERTIGVPRPPELGPAPPSLPPEPPGAAYEKLPSPPAGQAPEPEILPRDTDVFVSEPDRWRIPMPEWTRYAQRGEDPYARSSRWDPFNRNKWKGDYPLFGQTFFSFTGISNSFLDGRYLPTPSNVSAAQPGSIGFFGRGQQFALQQNFRFTFDLFHGDTSFRPVDWRIRITPEFNVNYTNVRELGVLNVDVRKGTTRTDGHVGLQEAFFEYKIHDLSRNYDFVSVRAGIQSFTSDFRGFLFVDEEPGVRIFGDLHSNRWQYNVAYFHMLEKDTNSGLNTFARRHQQVLIANIYFQDFIKPGYTTQFSIHYNKDDPTVHFDENGFLVRPAPIGFVVSNGQVRTHRVEAAYLGWTGDGHFGRLNITHAFYQALGQDDFNLLAGRRVTINAQMAAAEVSVDKDWARLKASIFYASGDANPTDGRARGFDAIVDSPNFAGGIFSLWNREGIRLTGTGVLLTPPDSLLPSLRSNKDEGQANFVNPGILLVHAGADFNVTPKMRGFANVSYLRFERTEPLQLLLFQSRIRHSIGFDYNVGVEYRPPLSENIKLTAGLAALTPGQGFRDIYTAKTLFSAFLNLRFVF
jgi:hypothetical protein